MIGTDLLLERCAALTLRLKARSALAEAERRVPHQSIRELAEAGIFRAFVPRRYGGDECDLLPVFEALIELAQGCVSTSWVTGLFAIHSLFLQGFCRRAQEDVWQDGPNALVASSVAPSGNVKRVGDGFLVRGKWAFVSGVDHCRWLILTAVVREPKPEGYAFLVPAPDFRIIDDWSVAGLCATGSKTIEIAADVFVPDYRSRSLLRTPARARLEEESECWLAHIPWQAIFTYAFAPAAIGNALSMLSQFRDDIATRRAPYTGIPFRDKQSSLLRLAYATVETGNARLLLERDIAQIENNSRRGLPFPADFMDRIPFDVAYIVECCTRAVDRLFHGSGGRALYATNPMQRCFRDMHAITQHAAIDPDTTGERFGKALLNLSSDLA